MLTFCLADLSKQCAREGALHPRYNFTDHGLLLLPVVSSATTPNGIYLAVVNLFLMEGSRGLHIHTPLVGLYYDNARNEHWFYSCGSKYLEGEIPLTERDSLLDRLFLGRPAPDADLLADTQDCYGAVAHNNKCSFKKNFTAAPTKGGCAHVRHMMHHLCAHPTILQGLRDAHATIRSTGKAPALKTINSLTIPATSPSPTIPALSSDPLYKTLDRFAGPNTGYKLPILIQGDHGSSKTFPTRRYSRTAGFDHVIEVGCHSDMEVYDFIGGQCNFGDSIIWLDGPVARAFRLAAAGKKVCLILDEIYRAPRRQRSLFLTSLSPDEGKLRLQTNRPLNVQDGVAEMEYLEAPAANLSIIATTNVGPDFDVEDDDPAGRDRWHIVSRFTSKDTIKRVLGEILAEKDGWNPSDTNPVITAITSFWEAMQKMKNDNMIASAPSTRKLAQAVLLAPTRASIKNILKEMCHTWVATDFSGHPIKEQLENIERCIDRTL